MCHGNAIHIIVDVPLRRISAKSGRSKISSTESNVVELFDIFVKSICMRIDNPEIIDESAIRMTVAKGKVVTVQFSERRKLIFYL